MCFCVAAADWTRRTLSVEMCRFSYGNKKCCLVTQCRSKQLAACANCIFGFTCLFLFATCSVLILYSVQLLCRDPVLHFNTHRLQLSICTGCVAWVWRWNTMRWEASAVSSAVVFWSVFEINSWLEVFCSFSISGCTLSADSLCAKWL